MVGKGGGTILDWGLCPNPLMACDFTPAHRQIEQYVQTKDWIQVSLIFLKYIERGWIICGFLTIHSVLFHFFISSISNRIDYIGAPIHGYVHSIRQPFLINISTMLYGHS